MDDLKKRYGVGDSFFHRYFIRNAENSFVNNLKRFMLWREGSFHNPKDKLRYVRKFLAEELENFYEKGLFILPQIGFALTTRCTLRCRDCIALSPLYDQQRLGKKFDHIDLTIDECRRELSLITNSVDGVKRLFLHGGEPLLNKDLSAIVSVAAECEKIELVELITNGSIIPSGHVLDALEKHKHKVYLAINNYSKNQELQERLHYDEIIALLDERSIKHPLYSDMHWYRQHPLEDQGYTPERARQIFDRCWCKHSLQILDGILAICPRASIGLLLGLVDTPPGDIISLRGDNIGDLRQKFLAFY
jgi:organic radical activating enzyme